MLYMCNNRGKYCLHAAKSRAKELTCGGFSATFSAIRRSLSATSGLRAELQDTFRYDLAGESGGQERRANVGKRAASKEAAFFVPDTFVILIATAAIAGMLTGLLTRITHEKPGIEFCLYSLLVAVFA
jgi:hypothetical protein